MHWLGLAVTLALADAQKPPVFPTAAEIVHVVVSVTDASGQPIRGLTAKAFAIREDGKPRSVSTLTPCGDPASQFASECSADVVLLLDASRSMVTVLDRARDEAVRFIKDVPSAHATSVVTFDSKIRISAFGEASPSAVVDQALADAENTGTRLFDAVKTGAGQASADPTRRAILLALTDGEDSGDAVRSTMNRLIREQKQLALLNPEDTGENYFDLREKAQNDLLAEVAAELQNRSVSFYAISFAKNLGGRLSTSGMRRVELGGKTLEALAKATGGLVVDGESDDLASEFARIRNDIAAQYVIGFAPASSPAGRSHTLKVTVKSPGAKARHRLAYQTR